MPEAETQALLNRVSSYPEAHNLVYLGPKIHPRDAVDAAVNLFFAQLPFGSIKTSGTEVLDDINSREDPRAVVAMVPHTSPYDWQAVDKVFRSHGRPIACMTKADTLRGARKLIAGTRRFFPVERFTVDRKALYIAQAVLESGGIVGSALEGTRLYGNPDQDPETVHPEVLKAREIGDTRVLNEAEPGLVYIALRAQAPIIVAIVLGVENLIPLPDDVIAAHGYSGLLAEVARTITTRQKPNILIHLSLYQDHLEDNRWGPGYRRAVAQEHAHRIILNHVIPFLPPGWPLGFYEGQSLQTLTGAFS